jgi:hypothetical protein
MPTPSTDLQMQDMGSALYLTVEIFPTTAYLLPTLPLIVLPWMSQLDLHLRQLHQLLVSLLMQMTMADVATSPQKISEL